MQIGWLYQCGYGESQDYKLAMEWYQKAASAGNAQGQYYIGLLYDRGWGVSKNYKQAINWYLKAANNGNTDAMDGIGSMYRYGTSIAKNIPAAIKWYTKAANQANARAQFNLGYVYQFEDQVKDLPNAVYWFQKAADNGNESAKSRVKQLKDQGYHAREGIAFFFLQLIHEKISNIHFFLKKKRYRMMTDYLIVDAQNQSSATSSHHEHFSSLIESRVETLERIFQSKMTLMEESNDTLQIELAFLRQEKQQQHEEIQLLKERLARIETDDECSHKKKNTAKKMEENEALQKELAILKQEKLGQFKETKQLMDELAKLKEASEDNNDLNYDSTDDEDSDTSEENKDVNTGCSEENVAHSKPKLFVHANP
jgi:TPR repeat protein